MKHLLLTLLVLTGLKSYQQTPNQFIIKGKINEVPLNTTVYLQLLPFDKPSAIIDSTKLLTDGSFRFQSSAKEQSLFLVGPEKGPKALFTNDANIITINISKSNQRFPDIFGSQGTKGIYQSLIYLVKKDSILNEIKKKLDSLELLDNVDSNISNLNNQTEQVIQEKINYVKSFVSSSNSPAAIYYVLIQTAPGYFKNDMELLELVTNADKRFKKHSGLELLQANIKKRIQYNSVPKTYPLQDKQAPELTMQGVDGISISISSFKGKYLLLDFWASWCIPCRKENPNIVSAYNKYKSKNFEILGISLDKDRERWLKAIEKDGLRWPQMSDLKFWESEAALKYKFDAIPFNVLIDPNGIIIANSLRGEELEKKLAELF